MLTVNENATDQVIEDENLIYNLAKQATTLNANFQ